MQHPEIYTLTRDEWLAIDQALAGAALAMALPCKNIANQQRVERRIRVRKAQNILGASYERAAKETVA